MGQEKYKMTLDHLALPESKEILKKERKKRRNEERKKERQ